MKKSVLALVACVVCLAPANLAAAEGETVTLEANTDRMGGDYRRLEASPSVEACHSACLADKECDAFTYVKSVHHCWLKRGVPGAHPNPDTVSGVKQRPAAGGGCGTVQGVTCEAGTDRPGADHQKIEAVASVLSCQTRCAAEPKCVAYTYVRSAKHCWLKTAVPAAQPNADAVSGVRVPAPVVAAPSTDGDLAGVWIFGPKGESWTLTRAGPGRYTAQETGFGNARGTVTVNGAEFRLDFTFSGGSGYFLGKIAPDGRRIETTRYHDGARFTFVRR